MQALQSSDESEVGTSPDSCYSEDRERRFGGLNRLYGPQALERLLASQVLITGVGGVGSWVAEGLARSGVGNLVLIDMDHVAESNINRQVQATDASLGQAKVQALAERIRSFAPSCRVDCIDDFVNPENAESLLTACTGPIGQNPRVLVLDCCDDYKAKKALILASRKLRIQMATAGGAGGKTEPWRIRPADLSQATHDPLLAKLRYDLRRHHGFAKDKTMKVPVFFSDQPMVKTETCEPSAGLNCAGYGSSVAVTSVMGMQMVGWALQQLSKSN